MSTKETTPLVRPWLSVEADPIWSAYRATTIAETARCRGSSGQSAAWERATRKHGAIGFRWFEAMAQWRHQRRRGCYTTRLAAFRAAHARQVASTPRPPTKGPEGCQFRCSTGGNRPRSVIVISSTRALAPTSLRGCRGRARPGADDLLVRHPPQRGQPGSEPCTEERGPGATYRPELVGEVLQAGPGVVGLRPQPVRQADGADRLLTP